MFCPSLSSAAAVHITQDPVSVEVGETVKLTCSATAVRKITDLTWTDTATSLVLRPKDEGVKNLSTPALGEENVSSMLTLFVKNKNGDKWPKNVKCKVELAKEDSNNGGSESFETSHKVKVTGKSLAESLVRLLLICSVQMHVSMSV